MIFFLISYSNITASPATSFFFNLESTSRRVKQAISLVSPCYQLTPSLPEKILTFVGVFTKIWINQVLEEIQFRYLACFFLTSMVTISSEISFIWHKTHFLIIIFQCIFFAIRYFLKIKSYYHKDAWQNVPKHRCNKKNLSF